MYIYHALINALSIHMIHINLNMIVYTHVEHSPTKTIYIKYYTEKQNKNYYKTGSSDAAITDSCYCWGESKHLYRLMSSLLNGTFNYFKTTNYSRKFGFMHWETSMLAGFFVCFCYFKWGTHKELHKEKNSHIIKIIKHKLTHKHPL